MGVQGRLRLTSEGKLPSRTWGNGDPVIANDMAASVFSFGYHFSFLSQNTDSTTSIRAFESFEQTFPRKGPSLKWQIDQVLILIVKI